MQFFLWEIELGLGKRRVRSVYTKSPPYEAIIQRNYGVYDANKQEEIRRASILVAGIGCDGGVAALILARVGIGRLTLVDFDTVEASNLNRQPLCTVSTIGQKKVYAAKSILQDCNPHVEIRCVDDRISDTSGSLLQDHDVILQCVDNYPGRVAIHRLASELGIPVVSMTGQPPYRAFVSTFLPEGPDFEDVLGLPSRGLPLTKAVENSLNDLKIERARNAASLGASAGWSDAYIEGLPGWGGEPVGWGITPERAYLTGTLQVHEALRIITGKAVLAAAPKAIIIDLLNPPNIVQIQLPPDGRRWNYREY